MIKKYSLNLTDAGSGETKVFDLESFGGSDVEATLQVKEIDGTTPQLSVVSYYSYDGVEWLPTPTDFDFTAKTAVGHQTIKLPFTGAMIKFEYDFTGDDTPTCEAVINVRASLGGSGGTTVTRQVTSEGGGSSGSSSAANQNEGSVDVTDTAAQIAIARPTRVAIIMQNRGEVSIQLSKEEAGADEDGWELGPGEWVSWIGQGTVWAATLSGTAKLTFIDFYN